MENVLLAHKSHMALARWANGALIAAFNGWLQGVAYRIEMRLKVAGAVKKMLLRELTAAWNQWGEIVLHQRTTWSKLEGAMRRLMLRGLSQAWNTWSDYVLLARKTHIAMSRWINSALMQAFRGWAEAAVYLKDTRFKLEGALRRMMLRELSGAWNTWLDNVMMAQKSHLALSRWANSTLLQAFHGWVEAAVYLSEMRFKVEGAVMRLMQRELNAAWNRWIENVLEAQKRNIALTRWVNSSLARAWEKWMEHMYHALRIQQSATKALRYWSQRALVSAFAAWVYFVEAREEQRQKLEGALARLMLRELSAAWNTWRYNSSKGVKLKSAMAFWTEKLSTWCFHEWRANAAESRYARKASAAVRWWRNQTVSKAFVAWFDFYAARTAELAGLRLAEQHLSVVTLQAHFQKWVAAFLDSLKVSAARMHRQKKVMSRVFRGWHAHSDSLTTERREEDGMVQALVSVKVLSFAFTRWVEAYELTLRFRSATVFTDRRFAFKAFQAWRGRVSTDMEASTLDEKQKALAGLKNAYTDWTQTNSPGTPRSAPHPVRIRASLANITSPIRAPWSPPGAAVF